MTIDKAISLIAEFDYDTCVATFINNKAEFKMLYNIVSEYEVDPQEGAKYGTRKDANVFYYYPVDGYYGHLNLEELKEDASVIMFEIKSKKQKLLTAIKDFR